MIQLTSEQAAQVRAQMTVVSYLERELAKRKEELATGLFLAFGVDMLREDWVFDPTEGVLKRVSPDPTPTGLESLANLLGIAGDAGQELSATNG
jgi:hypothetical protein